MLRARTTWPLNLVLDAMERPFCWQLMEKKIFHVTSRAAYAEIKKASCIKPSSIDLPASFLQSAKSYARRNSYVSLFDFVHCPLEKIDQIMHIWRPIVAKHNPTVLLSFDEELLADKLILNDILGEGFADRDFMSQNYYVPRVEAWYPDPLSLDLVTESHEVDWRNGRFKSLGMSGV